jgi:hypothetical protein
MNFAQRRGVKSKGAKANQDTSLAQSRLTIYSLHNNVPRDLFSASITARSYDSLSKGNSLIKPVPSSSTLGDWLHAKRQTARAQWIDFLSNGNP